MFLGGACWLKAGRAGSLSRAPSYVLGLGGGLLDGASVLVSLTSEVRGVSAYATFVVRNVVGFGGGLARVVVVRSAVAGRRAGVTLPGFVCRVRVVGRVRGGAGSASCGRWVSFLAGAC